MRRLFFILLFLLFVSISGKSSAAFERSIFQYHHRHWSEESDAPRPVFAVAQDRRGYLWIAAASGLYRFDGIRFEEMSERIDLVANGPPSAILVRRNGDIWTNFGRSGRFAVYRDGRLRMMRAPRSPERVITMHEETDGTVWILTERIGLPLLRYRNGQWKTFGRQAGAPFDNPFSMVVTGDGTVWVSFAASVARLTRNASRFVTMHSIPRSLGRLSMDPQERIWLTERRGTYPITGPSGRGKPPPLRHAYATDPAEIRGRPRFDREGNLWISTYYDGLQRVAHPDPRGAATASEARTAVEFFNARDGLSSNAMTQNFQDAEGNIWVGTEHGLDRFWPATVRFEPTLTKPAAFGDLLYAASDGAVYIGQASTIYRVAPGGHPTPIFNIPAEPSTLCEAPDGAIWIGVGKRIAIWHNGRVQWTPQRVPLASTLYDCTFDGLGDYWVTASFGGMVRLKGGKWEEIFGPAHRDFIPKSMLTDRKGRIYVQWNDRTLSRIEGAARTATSIPWDRYPPDDAALFATADNAVLVAGRFGLAQFRDGRFRSMSARRMPLLSGVNGISQTASGDVWLAGPAGIMQIKAADLEAGFADYGRIPKTRVFGTTDGLRSLPHDHSRRSMVRGGDGRLWIATQSGTVWLDPADIARSQKIPNISISALSADRIYRDPAELILPAGTSDIEINFAVLTFSNPRASQVRYRIEGQDKGWVDAAARRQAFYTNLKPGDYHFQVIAANADGEWNKQGATVDFTIPPTFIQSRWFLALCTVTALVLIWAFIRWRYAAAADRMHARLEERASERERISRDLHDTLLQAVQGLILQFQAAIDRMPDSKPQALSLQKALDLAGDVIAEGREKVRTLRGPGDESNIEGILRELIQAHPFDPGMEASLVVCGQVRPVDPLAVSEMALICGEVLYNIKYHARATKTDITLHFGRDELELRLADNGQGISQQILKQGGRKGHFGLPIMRERAEGIGGNFMIESEAGKGTVVTVRLAAGLAYADESSLGLHKRLKANLAAIFMLFSRR